jgi:hypothetical protein
MKPAEPQPEHHWLQKLVGEWAYEHECVMGPDQPPMKATGSESVRPIGKLWVQGEGRGEMPDGSPMTSVITLGYDPEKKRFVGTWIGSPMTHLWVYDGELDAARQKLSLFAEGPDFSGGPKLTKYCDAVEFVSDDHRTLTSSLLGDDGKWTQFMTAHYRRKK